MSVSKAKKLTEKEKKQNMKNPLHNLAKPNEIKRMLETNRLNATGFFNLD